LNAWEIAHGLNPNVDDTTGNPDGDIYDNWAEYMADTNPNDANAKQTFTFETDSLALRFSTSTNRRYTVEYSDDLSPGSWLPLDSPAVGTGASTDSRLRCLNPCRKLCA